MVLIIVKVIISLVQMVCVRTLFPTLFFYCRELPLLKALHIL